MTQSHHQPHSLEEALAKGYREIGDLETFTKRQLGLTSHATGGCNPPPPDNICLDSIMNGKHYVGFCVAGRGCVVTEAP